MPTLPESTLRAKIDRAAEAAVSMSPATLKAGTEAPKPLENTLVSMLQDGAGNGIIAPSTEAAGDGVRYLCNLDKAIYSCVTKDITTEEVVITDERIAHVKDRHPQDYERYNGYLKSIIEEPHYIIQTGKPNTALVLKEFREDNRQFRVVVRLHTTNDATGRANSILTFQYIKAREYARLIRNKEILYKATKT